MTFDLEKKWRGERFFQDRLPKKFCDNTIKKKCNGKMTSSSFSRNDGAMGILTHFIAKNHSKLPLSDFTHLLCF